MPLAMTDIVNIYLTTARIYPDRQFKIDCRLENVRAIVMCHHFLKQDLSAIVETIML